MKKRAKFKTLLVIPDMFINSPTIIKKGMASNDVLDSPLTMLFDIIVKGPLPVNNRYALPATAMERKISIPRNINKNITIKTMSMAIVHFLLNKYGFPDLISIS